MTNLANKTVLLTGANGGFGQQFVRQLLAKNCRLILTDLDAESLAQKAQSIQDEVGSGKIIACFASDLSTRNGTDALWQSVRALNMSVDVLINNAGIGVLGRHDEVPQDKWERLMQINLLAPMRLCALATPAMIAQRSGHIVNICSLAAWVAAEGMSAYDASKFGLRGFSEALSDELAEHNVRVSAVHPFFSRTPIIDSPQYGSLARSSDAVDRKNMTDPADVIREAIAAIEADRLHIFPDRIGRIAHRLKRHTPRLLTAVQKRLTPVRK